LASPNLSIPTSVSRAVFWRAQGAALVVTIVVVEGAPTFGLPVVLAVGVTVAAAQFVLIALRLRDAAASAWFLLVPCMGALAPAPAGWWYANATLTQDAELGALIPPLLGLMISLAVCSAFLLWVGLLPTRIGRR